MPKPLRILDQLILREFIPLFGVGILTFTVLIASFTILKDAVDYAAKGIPLEIVIQGFLFGLAQVVAYTLPMAVLLGSLLAFGRLSGSGEITALRAGGVNFFRIATPVLVAGFFVACLAFVFNERIAPALTLRALKLVQTAALKAGVTLSNKQIVYYFADKDAGKGYILAAGTSVGNTFNDFKLDVFSPEESTIYYAKKAIWDDQFWVLQDATYLVWKPYAAEPVSPVSVAVGEIRLDLNKTPGEIMEATIDPEEMALAQLGPYIHVREKQLASTISELEVLQADPAADPVQLAALQLDVQKQQRSLLKIKAKYQLKISAPFACMIFVLLAAPLGMNPLRSTSSMGFGLSMILVFVYYFLTTMAVNLAGAGILPPVVVAWIPNLVFALYGFWLNGQFEWSSGK